MSRRASASSLRSSSVCCSAAPAAWRRPRARETSTTAGSPSTTAGSPSTTTTTVPPTSNPAAGSIGIQPPLFGPTRGAEPNGPQVPSGLVTSEATDPTGEYTPLTPTRILDTRDGTGGVSGPFGPKQIRNVRVAGVGGVPGASVTAAVLNVTVTNTSAPSYLTVWPLGPALPVASNLNWSAGTTIANLVTVRLGAFGMASIYNDSGSADVIVDVAGYYSSSTGPAGARFHPLAPSRYFDTRDAFGPIGPDRVRGFDATGRNGVPDTGVVAVAMNVTVTEPTAPSFLTVYPGDQGTAPLASNLDFTAGQTLANLVIVRVPANGIIDFYNLTGSVNVIADVVGWYDEDRTSENGRFVPLDPARVLDTRTNASPVLGGTTRFLGVAGNGGVPLVGAGAVVMNVTATEPTELSYLTVHPDGVPTPLASNLNFPPGQTVPNLVIGRLSSGGALRFFNKAGAVHVIADVAGYFTGTTLGFDTCVLPSVATMNTWKTASPYSTIGIYFGGALRACPPDALNSATWVNTVTAQGWRLIPTYVGPQAPCTGYSQRIDPAVAFDEGIFLAGDAASHAALSGLPPGSPLYYDMEAYNTSDATCSLAVREFIAGWVTELHVLGYKAGFYSSLNAGIADMVRSVGEGRPPVDAIWIAAWNNTPNVFGFDPAILPDGYWTNHQRIHQYQGGHNETWGGVTLNIDTNAVDGPLAP